jgi:hypothetical protein
MFFFNLVYIDYTKGFYHAVSIYVYIVLDQINHYCSFFSPTFLPPIFIYSLISPI